MRWGDAVLALVRVLAALHGLVALAGFGYGVALAAADLAAGDDGLWDGFGIVMGAMLVAVSGVPLLLAVVAVGSTQPVRVRASALLIGVLSVGGAVVLLPTQGLLAAPGGLLVVLAVAHVLLVPDGSAGTSRRSRLDSHL